MFNTELFDYAEIHCANDYIMSREESEWKKIVDYIENNDLRLDSFILKPKSNQVRLRFLPCRANKNVSEVFTITHPSVQFLRRFWNLEITELQNALTQYMLQSNLKQDYKNLEEPERNWIATIILGSKESEE